MIRDAICDEGLLTCCEDVQLLSSEDIEVLYVGANGSMDLEGILTRKAAMRDYVHRDLTAYLYDNESDKLRPSETHIPGYKDLWEVLKERLTCWGMTGLN
jgi:hypothetical protein